MNAIERRAPGFTLIELMIALAISGVLLGAAFSLFTSQHKQMRIQEQVAEAQQNARAALQLVSRDLVMAGYSTAGGIVFANTTSLTIRSGLSTVSFKRYSGASIGRTVGGSREAVAEDVRMLRFDYRDSGGNVIAPGATGTVTPTSSIKQIQISVTTGTPAFGSYSGSCTLMTTVSPRNL